MRNSQKKILLLMMISISVFATWGIWSRAMTNRRTGHSNNMNMEKQKQQIYKPKDPCWFVSLKNNTVSYEVIKEREDRELKGYPEEITLSEAIRTLNEEKKCFSAFASYPPLTEDELIASIVAGSGSNLRGEAREFQEDILWKIATKKVMPKGSLLMYYGGPLVQESPLRPYGTIRAEGISIVIRLGLENYEPGQHLKPEQSYIIRRTYFKVEIFK